MPLPEGIFLNSIDGILLVFSRMTGLFVISPVFGRRNLPAYVKIALAFMMSLIIIQTLKIDKIDYAENIWMYAMLVAKEFIAGMAIGYVSFMVFTAIYFAGQIIDTQIGFGIVNVIDPLSNIQIPITSNFYFILSMLVFLIINGHHVLIQALFESYRVVPVGQVVFTQGVMDDMLRILASTFMLGFRISGPVVAAVLVSDVALGVISKTIPQMNVFVVGLPLKILLGMLAMVVTLPIFLTVLDTLINGMNTEMFNLAEHMAPR